MAEFQLNETQNKQFIRSGLAKTFCVEYWIVSALAALSHEIVCIGSLKQAAKIQMVSQNADFYRKKVAHFECMCTMF